MVLVVVLAGTACGGDDAGRAADDDGRSTTEQTTGETTGDATGLGPVTRPAAVAHRGAAGLAPENTFAAFDLAVEHGADLIELDLQLTADGALVVLHDPGPDRTTTGAADDCTGPIDTLTLEQVQSCDAGSWFNEANPDRADPTFVGLRIPSLSETLDRYGTDVRWLIETKTLLADDGSMEQALVDALDAAGFTADAEVSQQVVVQSFEIESLRRVRDLRPDLTLTYLGSLGEGFDEEALDALAEEVTGLGPNQADVDEALIAAAHERCLTVVPYTIDDPVEMTRLLELGVDGVISNRIDLLVPLVAGREWSPPCG